MRFSLTYFFVRQLRDARFPAVPDGLRLEEKRDEIAIRSGEAAAHVSRVFRTPGGPMLGGSFTRPEFRGRGLYALALRWLCARLALEGAPVAYVSCDVRNEASRRGILAAGFRYERVAAGLELGAWDPGVWIDRVFRRMIQASRAFAKTTETSASRYSE